MSAREHDESKVALDIEAAYARKIAKCEERSYSLGFGEAWRTLNAINGQDQPVPQRQDGLDDQLRDVVTVATEMGCYDAADWIKSRVLKAPYPDPGDAA